MKALVVYSTLTGNTKKVAEAVAKAFPEGTECVRIQDAPAPDGYDVIALGFWVDKGHADDTAAEYMKKITGKKIFTFFTLGAYPDGEHAKKCAASAGPFYGEGNTDLGIWWCQGAIDPKLIEMMKKMPAGGPHSPTPEALKRWDDASHHPDAADLEAATAAAKKAVEGLF